MSVRPSVKVSASETLQRSYFTSELFVKAARADIESLLSTFEHLAEDEVEPYTVFKRIWVKEGWNYAHLFIWEDTAREGYMQTMFRLLLERVKESEDELIQVGAIFALYTLFEMQLGTTTLHRITHIPITIDTLEQFAALAKSSMEPHQLHVLYILQYLITEPYLHILPPSDLRPCNPTDLPHSYIDRSQESHPTKQIGKGGKTRTELDRQGRQKWQMLGTWVDERASLGTSGGDHTGSLRREEGYESDKAAVLDIVTEEVEAFAEGNALARLKALSNHADLAGSSEGTEWFERRLEEGSRILRNR